VANFGASSFDPEAGTSRDKLFGFGVDAVGGGVMSGACARKMLLHTQIGEAKCESERVRIDQKLE
jgi:hypothetical protein